jgi:hypothetical protein
MSWEKIIRNTWSKDLMFCKNCGHPMQEVYHCIYRHINDNYAGKECVCGCKNPDPELNEDKKES